jgi:Tfp pilus assembly protein PilX
MTGQGPVQQSLRYQRGTATLVVAIVLLVAITMIVLFANRSIVFEQRTSANQYRSTKALAAAEAGLEWALAQLNTPLKLGAACTAAGGTKTFRDNYLDPSATDPPAYASTSASYSAAMPACVRQSGGGWACSCPAGTSATVGAVACDDATGACPKFVVRFERIQNPALGATCSSSATNCVTSAVKVTSTGFTDTNGAPDGTAKVTQMLRTVPGLSAPPAAPLTVKLAVSLSGNLAVTNTDSATNGITINSGGAVTLGGSSSLVTVPGTPPSASVASDDSTLSSMTDDQMFQTFFGMSKADFQNMPTTTQITCGTCGNSDIGDAINAGANVIWVNGDLQLNANGNFGSATHPVIIIVTGNIHANGNVNITGLVYSQAAVWDNSGGGSASICGAAIAEGSFTGQGTPNPTYCSSVLSILKRTTGAFVKVPGSWRDF